MTTVSVQQPAHENHETQPASVSTRVIVVYAVLTALIGACGIASYFHLI